MKIKDIADKIDEIIPLKLAQDWDNVGLLIGDSQKDVKNILLTIDITRNVVAEAKKLKTELIIGYHPVIWDALKKITAEGPAGVVYDLIRSGIAVFAIHTALDSAVGGVNDGLAEIIGIVNGEPIGDYVANPAGDNYKLVVFVPAGSAAEVSHGNLPAPQGCEAGYRQKRQTQKGRRDTIRDNCAGGQT
jgi:dinuclear metal center YbgI/SA1388 family protein